MQLYAPEEFRHVTYLWDDARADFYGPGRAGWSIAPTCSAPTSASPIPAAAIPRARYAQVDPLTGADVDIMYVKGSGGDLRTSQRENFAALYMDKLMRLQAVYNAAPTSRASRRRSKTRWSRCTRIASIT